MTGLINNSNLLKDTTDKEILAGQSIVQKVSDKSGLPIVFTTVWQDINCSNLDLAGELVKMKLYFRKDWF